MEQQKRIHSSGGEDQALLSRLGDLVEQAARWGKPCFSSFLTEHEQAVAGRLRPLAEIDVFLWGGYPDAERRVFTAFPEQISSRKIDYPFDSLTILMPRGYSVSHRDALGALMALGVKRETMGDILVGEELLVVFAMCPAADLILRELRQIGRVGVRCERGVPEILPAAHRLECIDDTISSMRLDCVVAMIANVSRSESARLIAQGLIGCNAQTVCAPAKEVAPGDKISVRGVGKFQIATVGAPTKKGRLRVTYYKYC